MTSIATDSMWRLRADLASAKVLIWAATVGRDAELSVETHLYLADRYARLSQLHAVRGHIGKARRLAAVAADHFRAAGGDGPPFAAAMAMPRPQVWTVVDAIAEDRKSA